MDQWLTGSLNVKIAFDLTRILSMEVIEARKAQRKRAMLGATIVFNNRNSTIECKIRNISEDGAKIVVSEDVSFPQRFDFNVPQHGRSYQAKVIWRHGGETGLEFINDVVAGREVLHGDELAERLRELEGENALLRKRVIDLKAQLDRYYQVG